MTRVASESLVATLVEIQGVGDSVSIVRSFSKLTVIKPVSMHLAVQGVQKCWLSCRTDYNDFSWL
jgi:hypothetical protein